MSWPMVKLGDVAPSRPLKNPKIEDAERVWLLNLDMVEANSGQIIEKCYQSLDVAGSSTHWFDANHVLYSKLRPYLNKVVTPDEQGLATTELVPLLPDPKQLDRHFLAYYLRSSEFVQWISEQVAGAKMPRVSMDLFWNHEIPLPPLAEQKRIAAILEKADAIRRKRQQAIQLADDFLRAVFLETFGDPVTNPKGLEVKPLGEITTFENGDRSSNYPSGDDIVNSGVLFLSTKNIVADTLDLQQKQFITEDKYKQLSRGKARKGDLIITLRGTLGACCIFDGEYEKAFINAQMMIIRPGREILAGFLHDFLVTESIKCHFQRIGQGAAVPQLTAKQFRELLIPLPTLELQLKYETIRRFVLATTMKLSGGEEQDFFNSLSQKAFSGQL